MRPDYKQYDNWNLERALSEAQQAAAITPLPTYTMQQANCL